MPLICTIFLIVSFIRQTCLLHFCTALSHFLSLFIQYGTLILYRLTFHVVSTYTYILLPTFKIDKAKQSLQNYWVFSFAISTQLYTCSSVFNNQFFALLFCRRIVTIARQRKMIIRNNYYKQNVM
jgi:hypothetical protein